MRQCGGRSPQAGHTQPGESRATPGHCRRSSPRTRKGDVAARTLRPGGRLALADIVTTTQLPEGVTCDAALWAACIGGAMQRDDCRRRNPGRRLHDQTWRENPEYRFISERVDNATTKYGVTNISLLTTRH